ncbi:hypothetical protein HMPREF0198_0420 [Cardiobacterium hominis ATCC 15826]|uniref:Uncharacterized protein n=1 Tax=Cardiobacterium hominis (strain ATCC 15826 / DSM 8339 / NCTC 10426 / 6573) TaxID=638300 RepID=C8N7E3_CARH6|nr:hypothetical protein HMPREF0198_0420 [Cardiobacterium hominis ATCC 15826]
MGSFASLQVVSGIIHTPERFRGRCIWLVDSRYNHPGSSSILALFYRRRKRPLLRVAWNTRIDTNYKTTQNPVFKRGFVPGATKNHETPQRGVQ